MILHDENNFSSKNVIQMTDCQNQLDNCRHIITLSQIKQSATRTNSKLRQMSSRYQQSYIQNPHVFGSLGLQSIRQNYHQRPSYPNTYNNNFTTSKNSIPKTLQSMSLDQNRLQLQNFNEVPQAINYKQRLQSEVTLQMKRQIQKFNYRKQLQQQMKADQDRKMEQKIKNQKYETQRQKKFYAQLKIQAQKQNKTKQQPSYFILRSSKRQRTSRNLAHSQVNGVQSRDLDVADLKGSKVRASKQVFQPKMPRIMKRGGYHNESTLGNIPVPESQNQNGELFPGQQPKQFPPRIKMPKSTKEQQIQKQKLQIIRQRNYQEQRISKIIKFQQMMLRKLDHFRQQIHRTDKYLGLNREVQNIRNILKSKPIRLDVISFKENQLFQNNVQFYQSPNSGPKNSGSTRPRNRSNKTRMQQGINLNEEQTQSPQRILTAQKLKYQQDDYSYNSLPKSPLKSNIKAKGQIRLFDRKKQNDKNYNYKDADAKGNKQASLHLPVVNQNPQDTTSYQNECHLQ